MPRFGHLVRVVVLAATRRPRARALALACYWQTGPGMLPKRRSGPLVANCVVPFCTLPRTTTVKAPDEKPSPVSHLMPVRPALGSGFTRSHGCGDAETTSQLVASTQLLRSCAHASSSTR